MVQDKDFVILPGRDDACGICFTAITSGFDVDYVDAMARYNSKEKANKPFVKDVDKSCDRLARLEADEELEYFDPPSSVKAVQLISESMSIECLFLTECQLVKLIGLTSSALKLEKVNRLSECGRKVVVGFYVRFDDLPDDIRERDLLGLRKVKWELKFVGQHDKEILQPSRQLRLAQGADVLPGVAARMPDRSAPNPLELLASMPTISSLRKKAADLEEKRRKKDVELAAKLEVDDDGNPVDIADEDSDEPRMKGALSSGLGTTTIDRDAGLTRKRKKGASVKADAQAPKRATGSLRGDDAQAQSQSQSQDEIKAALNHDPELCKVALKLGNVPDSLTNFTVRRALEGAKMGNACTGATRLLDKLGEGSKEGRSLSRRIAAVQAAQLLATTADLATLPYEERISKYVLVGATGSAIPLLIKVKVTVAEVSEAVKGFVTDGAAAKLQGIVSMLILCKGSVEEEWSFTKPTFAHVVTEAMQLSGDDERRGREARDLGTPKGKEQAEEVDAEIESRWEALAGAWVDAFANDTLLGLIPATSTSSYSRLLDVCSSMLTALNAQVTHIPEDFPAQMRGSIERVTSFCKCICCLAAPLPNYMDCTFRDAFVLSKYSGTDYMEAEIKNAIGRKGSFWQEAFDAEQRVSSAVKEFAPVIRQYLADMDKIIKDASAEDKDEEPGMDCGAACKLVFEVLGKREHMASNLRKGALQDLDSMIQSVIPLLMERIAKDRDLKSIADVKIEDFMKLASKVPAVGKPVSGYPEALDKFAQWQATNQTALQSAKLKELCQSATTAEHGKFDIAAAWGVLQTVDLESEEAEGINLQHVLMATLQTVHLKVEGGCSRAPLIHEARKEVATAKGMFQKVPMALSARQWLLQQLQLLEDCLSHGQACRRFQELGRDAKERDAKDSERMSLDAALKTVASLRIKAAKSKKENESLATLAASKAGAVFADEAEPGKEDDAPPTTVDLVLALEHACCETARSMADNPTEAITEALQLLISKQLEACKSDFKEARKLLCEAPGDKDKGKGQDAAKAEKPWTVVAGWKDKLPENPSLQQVMDAAASIFGSVDGSALREKIAHIEKALLGIKTVHARYGPHLKHFGMQDEIMALTTGDYTALSEDGKAMAALGAEALLWYANQHTNQAIAKSILGEVSGRISGDFVDEARVEKTLLAEGRRILG
ncbi:unnamed protein product [Symbiodinium sp. CCMP2592]|nr:unnamed protein product [Symbiodinium sp. CCMP2592]